MIFAPQPTGWIYIYGFTPRTQLFGSAASVVHYNAPRRMFCAIANGLLGNPVVGYVDDFACICPISIGQGAMCAFQKLADISGANLKKKKSRFEQTDIFLGIEGSMPNRSSGMQPSVRLPAEQAWKCSPRLEIFLSSDTIEHAWLGRGSGYCPSRSRQYFIASQGPC